MKFGWCLDGLHEGCKNSYTIMWPHIDEYGPKRVKSKEKIVQEERVFECSCECHERTSVKTETKTKDLPIPRAKSAPKKKASRSRQ